MRLLADLHMGRVDAAAVRFDLPNAHDRVDLAALSTTQIAAMTSSQLSNCRE